MRYGAYVFIYYVYIKDSSLWCICVWGEGVVQFFRSPKKKSVFYSSIGIGVHPCRILKFSTTHFDKQASKQQQQKGGGGSLEHLPEFCTNFARIRPISAPRPLPRLIRLWLLHSLFKIVYAYIPPPSVIATPISVPIIDNYL